jgi:hypothetical protein
VSQALVEEIADDVSPVPDSPPVRRVSPAAAGAAVLVAATVYFSGRSQGSYTAGEWPLLGLGLVAAVWLLIAAGRRVTLLSLSAVGLLAVLGGWMAASVAWGGVPEWAWTSLDMTLLGALAFLVGALAGAGLADALLLGVLTGLVAQAVEILARFAWSGVVPGWFYARALEGPVGYHNAQACLFAVGLPLAVRELGSSMTLRRVAGGIAGTVLLSALLLTQSRGALFVGVAGLMAQVLYWRRLAVALRALPLLAAGGVLLWRWGVVDAALVRGSRTSELVELRHYAAVTALCAVGAALWALLPFERVHLGPRTARLLVAGILACAVAAGTVERGPISSRVGHLAGELRSDATPDPAPGTSRLGTLALNGRLEAWRVALHVFEAKPVGGEGEGRFASTWTRARSTHDLYILQPHSLELELMSETGLVGLGLFIAFVVVAVAGIRRAPDRSLAAAVGASFLTLLGQASFDWTWSFPGLVAPVLLLVGASGDRAPPQRVSRGVFALTGLAVLGVGTVFAVRYLADRDVHRAESVVTRDPRAAKMIDDRALRLDPWSPDAVELQAEIAGETGDAALAAERFLRAAELSSHPWLDHYRAAQMLARAGSRAATRRECRIAADENPLEWLVTQPPCTP